MSDIKLNVNDNQLAEDAKMLATEEGDYSFKEIILEGSKKSRLSWSPPLYSGALLTDAGLLVFYT